jgi:hypothetical protein
MKVQCVDMDGRPILPMESIICDEVIRVSRDGQHFAYADIARLRLKQIIRRDRESIQTGRWVKQGSIPFWFRPRYRFEVRR